MPILFAPSVRKFQWYLKITRFLCYTHISKHQVLLHFIHLVITQAITSTKQGHLIIGWCKKKCLEIFITNFPHIKNRCPVPSGHQPHINPWERLYILPTNLTIKINHSRIGKLYPFPWIDIWLMFSSRISLSISPFLSGEARSGNGATLGKAASWSDNLYGTCWSESRPLVVKILWKPGSLSCINHP